MTDRNGNVTTYSYDENYNLVSESIAGNTTYYAYNKNEWLTEVKNCNNKTKTISYDTGGRIISETDFEGNVTEYTYDNSSRLTSTTTGGATINYGYDNNGRLIKESRPNGTIQIYTYNTNGQLISATDQKFDGSIINKYDYEYDADGNIITEDNINEPNYDNITIPSSEMNYGSANRLIDFNGTVISYDNDGNMLNTLLGEN